MKPQRAFPLPAVAPGVVTLGVVIMGVVVAGCDARVPGADAPTVTDSAGIRIVESPEPRLPLRSWQVTGEREILCAGGGPRGDDRVFRAGRLLPLDDGGAALFAFSGHLVLVCRGGEVGAEHGGQGEGPGEFAGSAVALVDGPGDSVVVVERGTLTLLDLEDGGSRRISIGSVAGEVEGATRFLGGLHGVAALRAVAGPGEYADLVVLDLADLPAPLARMSDVPWSQALGVTTLELFLWSPGSRYALEGERYWWGVVETGEVRRYGISGLEEIRRAPVARPAAGPDLISWAVERGSASLRADNPGLPEAMLESMFEVEDPVRPPGVLAIVPASNGELWVRVPEPDPRTDGPRWRVFASDGEWVTDVELPFRFRLQAVVDDHLFGVRSDDLELEWVEQLTLERR